MDWKEDAGLPLGTPDARYLTIIFLLKTEAIHIDECEHLPLVHAHVSATLLNPLLSQFLHY